MFTSLRNILQKSNATKVAEYAKSNGFDLSNWELNKLAEANNLAADGFSAPEFYAEMVANYGFPNAGVNTDPIIGSRNSQNAR